MNTLDMLFNFAAPEAAEPWQVIDDGVMGGVSAGHWDHDPTGYAVFHGMVSLANNGGFSSLRSRPGDYRLAGRSGLRLRTRGDGQRYAFNVWPHPPLSRIAFQYRFLAERAWTDVDIPFAALEPRFRGRRIEPAPRFDPNRISAFGLLISDKQAGPFRLDIAWIAAF